MAANTPNAGFGALLTRITSLEESYAPLNAGQLTQEARLNELECSLERVRTIVG